MKRQQNVQFATEAALGSLCVSSHPVSIASSFSFSFFWLTVLIDMKQDDSRLKLQLQAELYLSSTAARRETFSGAQQARQGRYGELIKTG
jgi:hypothetical protein